MIVPDIKIMVRDDLPEGTIVVCTPPVFTIGSVLLDDHGNAGITVSWDPKKVGVLKGVGC